MKGNVVLGFDVGGTWTRFAVSDLAGTTTLLSRSRTISFASSNKHVETKELPAVLARTLAKYVNEYCKSHPRRRVVRVCVSLGAALNHHTGEVYGSGPLWGQASGAGDTFVEELAEQTGPMDWVVVNDITAHLLSYLVDSTPKSAGKTMLITLSTGIGCRIYDHDRNVIPLQSVLGIQGEIGHVATTFCIGERKVSAVCDCGGQDHLNAFCSGSGLKRTWAYYDEILSEKIQATCLSFAEGLNQKNFAACLNSGDLLAHEIMHEFTKPIALLILNAVTLDPRLDRIALTGGLVNGLSPHYANSIRNHFKTMEQYIVSEFDPNFFDNAVHFVKEDPLAGVRGACIYGSRDWHSEHEETKWGLQ